MCDLTDVQMFSDEGGDATARLTENLSRDVGTTLYSAPEQLDCTEHSTKVISYHCFQLMFNIRPVSLLRELLRYNNQKVTMLSCAKLTAKEC